MGGGVVLFKFKSSVEQHTVHFDGPHISVSSLKREIAATCKLPANDQYLLELSNAQTAEVFADDANVCRNVAVLVRRVPMHRRAPIQSKREGEMAVDGLDTPKVTEHCTLHAILSVG